MSGKIVLNLAMSLDGYIVDNEGKYDWIKGDGDTTLNTDKQFDMAALINKFDVAVMGYTSYEEFGSMDMFIDKELVVATSKNMKNKENVTFVSDGLISYSNKLRSEGKHIWLFGGSILTDNFIKANEVDRYEVGIVPIILGNGKRLFFKDNPTIELHLEDYTITEGMPILVYTRRSEQ